MRAGALCVLVLLVPQAASAVEKQHHLGVDTGVAILSINKKDGPAVGWSWLGHWAYGLTDQFQVAVEGGYSLVSLGEKKDQTVMQSGMSVMLPNNRPAHVIQGSAGVNYVFDVIRWVLYGGVYATAFGLLGGNLPSARFVMGATLAAGLDYQVTRAFTVGFAARQHFPFSALDDYPSFTQFMLRSEVVWGW